MSRFVAALAAVAALSFFGSAHAAAVYTYNLDVADPAAGFGAVDTFGTVTVTDNGLGLHFDVELATGYEFRKANDSNHHGFVLDIDQTGLVLQSINPSKFTQSAPGPFHDAPFGQPAAAWNYALDCATCKPGWNPTKNATSLKFKIAGISINDLASVPYTSTHGVKNIFFAADLVNAYGKTGNVGATWDGHAIFSAPEPATWALMVTGMGFVGAGLRRRKAVRALTA